MVKFTEIDFDYSDAENLVKFLKVNGKVSIFFDSPKFPMFYKFEKAGILKFEQFYDTSVFYTKGEKFDEFASWLVLNS